MPIVLVLIVHRQQQQQQQLLVYWIVRQVLRRVGGGLVVPTTVGEINILLSKAAAYMYVWSACADGTTKIRQLAMWPISVLRGVSFHRIDDRPKGYYLVSVWTGQTGKHPTSITSGGGGSWRQQQNTWSTYTMLRNVHFHSTKEFPPNHSYLIKI